jgi:hypothetical protein
MADVLNGRDVAFHEHAVRHRVNVSSQRCHQCETRANNLFLHNGTKPYFRRSVGRQCLAVVGGSAARRKVGRRAGAMRWMRAIALHSPAAERCIFAIE